MSNSVSFDLNLAIKDFNNNLKNVDKNLNSFHSDFKKSAAKSSAAWSSFAGNLGAKAVATATNAIAGLIVSIKDFGKEAFYAAVDAQETASKFEAVFSLIGEKSGKMAKELQRNYGLGVTESKTLLSATGDLLTGFGFAQEEALKLSSDVQKLSVDLASFTNFSGGAKGASEAITKALLGERESVKALGVSIQEKDVQSQVAINRAKGMIFETERQAKAQATLDLIVKQSGNAIGDYAKTSSGAANQLKLLNVRLEDMKIAIGNKLIPVVTPLVEKMIKWVEANEDFVAQNVQKTIEGLTEAFSYLKDNMNTIIRVAKIALGTLIAFKTVSIVISAIDILTTSMIGLKAAMVVITGPIGLVIAGLTALGGAVAWAMAQGKDSEAIDNINALKVATADLVQLEKDLLQAQEMGSSSRVTDAIQARIEARKIEIESLQEDNLTKEELTEEEIKRIEKVTQAKIDAQEKETKAKSATEKLTAAKEKKKAALLLKEQDKANKQKLKQSEFEETLFGKQVKWEELGGKERANNLKSTLSTMATLSESGNKTLAGIGRAAAISTATIDGIAAVQKALASAPPPVNFALAGVVGVAAAANVAKISGVKFEHGGVVGGSSFTGDSVQARVNSGEMIINRSQQSMLFHQISNGSGGGSNDLAAAIDNLGDRISRMEVVLVADDTEIARSASRGVQNGVIIGESR